MANTFDPPSATTSDTALAQELLYLALDQGGHGTRAAVYNHKGEKVASASVDCHTRRPRPDVVEQDSNDILDSFYQCLAQVTNALGEARTQAVCAAGLACQGSTLLCWHRQTGHPLSAVISWQDCRAADWLQQLAATAPPPLAAATLHRYTGLRLSPHYGASKMHWCLQHLPNVKAAAEQGQLVMGPLASFVLQQLTDNPEPQVDISHAQRTLLLSLHTGEWHRPLCQTFGIDTRWLPHCRPNRYTFGTLYLERGTLERHPVPVTTCLRDQGASLFAHGPPDCHSAYINLGTGAFLQRLIETSPKGVLPIAPHGLLLSPLWLDQDRQWYSWEGTVNGAGAAVPWLQQHLGFKLSPTRIQQALQRASQAPTGRPRYFINGCAGLGSPYWRSDVTPSFSDGLTADEKISAWIESLIFLLHTNLKLMETATPLRQIRISGGFSNLDHLCQGLADITGLSVYRASDTDSTLQGVASLCADLPENWVREPADDVFTPCHNQELTNRHYHWQKVMPPCRPTDG